MAYVIQIEVDAELAKKGSKEAVKSIRSVGSSSEKADRSVSKMEASMKRAAQAMKVAAVAAVALAVAMGAKLARSIISIGVEFEQLRAQLKTVEGGLDGATAAFARIQEFAKSTPFEVDRITEAWINLRGMGLEPTMKQFEALGNLAAARSKDITEASMAVTGAIFGETERLKAFGIAAKISGDEITLSYKGISTTVKRTADEVVRAIVKISDQNFGTAMEEQANTVAGSWSNLQDAWAAVVDAIFTSGIDEIVTDILRDISDGLNDVKVSATSASDLISKSLGALGVAFDVALIAASAFAGYLAVQGIAAVITFMAGVTAMDALMLSTAGSFFLAQAAAKSLVATLGTAMAAIGPAGWVAIGVGAIVTAFVLWKRAWEEVDELVSSSADHLARIATAIDKVTESTKDQRDELERLTKARIEDLEATLLGIEAQIELAKVSNGLFFGGLYELLQSGRMTEIQGAIIGLQNKLRDLGETNEWADKLDAAFQQEIDRLGEVAGAANDAADALSGSGSGDVPSVADAWSTLAESAASTSALIADAMKLAGEATEDAGDKTVEVWTRVAESIRTQAQLLDDAMSLADGGEGGGDGGGISQGVSSGVVQLVNAMDGLDDLSRNLVGAFTGLASAMSSTEITANDWITLVVQIVLAFASASKKASQKAAQAARELSNAMNDLRTSLNKLEEVTTKINEKYDKITKQLQENTVYWDEGERSLKKLGDVQVWHSTLEDQLAEAEKKRALELEMATRQVQQEGFSGLIQMFEDLGIYLKGTEEAARFAKEMERLKIELEIINFRIQLDMLRALGTIAAETLDWIEAMINKVEAGLRSGEFTVGGAPSVPRGGRRPRRPRDTGPELPDALDLLGSIYQATGNLEALAELEAIRFEVERANMLSQIDLLLASGTISDEMADRLRKARADLEGFDFSPVTDAVDSWAEAMGALRGLASSAASDAQILWDAWDAANQAALDTSTTADEILDKLGESWKIAHEAAERIALTMIESLAQAVGSEEDIAKLARLRHFLEVQSYRAQAELLRPLLDADTAAWLDSLIDAFELMDPTAGLGGGSSGGFGGGVVGAIEDQTDALLAGWQSVLDNLLTGPGSPLTPGQQVEYLQGEYNRLLALARSGDQDAEMQLQQMIPSLVQAMSLFTGGTATTAFNDFFQGLIADISMLSGIANPLLGLGAGGGGTAATDNIIGSFRDFRVSAESSADRAHDDSEDLKTEFGKLGQKFDLFLAQQAGAGSN